MCTSVCVLMCVQTHADKLEEARAQAAKEVAGIEAECRQRLDALLLQVEEEAAVRTPSQQLRTTRKRASERLRRVATGRGGSVGLTSASRLSTCSMALPTSPASKAERMAMRSEMVLKSTSSANVRRAQ